MSDNNWWHHSPVVVKKLLVPELLSVGKEIAEGKNISGFDEDHICHCSFARRCLLTCRHIFHLNTVTPILTVESENTIPVCSQRVAWQSGSTGMVYAVEEVMLGGGKVGGVHSSYVRLKNNLTASFTLYMGSRIRAMLLRRIGKFL